MTATRGDRCPTCGVTTFTFDPPLEIEEQSEDEWWDNIRRKIREELAEEIAAAIEARAKAPLGPRALVAAGAQIEVGALREAATIARETARG